MAPHWRLMMVTMIGLAEGCQWIEAKVIEDGDRDWELILESLDRWGDRRVPQTGSLPFTD